MKNAFRSARPWFRSPLSLAIASTLACAAAPALAQDTAEQSSRSVDAAQTLDAVIVTANKRVENVREVGASISVIGERQLENIGASSLSDYAALIPGLQVQDSGSPGLTEVSLRGVSALSSSATVATYIDEVPVGSSGIYQSANSLMLDLLPYDINRVEVLRGPQGTLYGAGAIGGLLKYVTSAPDLSGGEVRVGMGLQSVGDGDNGWNGRFGVSVPLQEDRLGLRMSFARNEIPGYVDNQVDGRENINSGEQVGGRLALAWDGETVDANLALLHQRIRSADRANVALDPDTYAPLFGDFVGQAWQPQPFSKDLTLASLSLDWDLGWADFVSATGWSETRTLDQIDATVQFGDAANVLLGLPAPGSSFARYEFDLDKLTQEFRFSSKSGGRFEWMTGVFYTREDALQSQFVPLRQLDGTPLPAPFDTLFGTLAYLELPSIYEEFAVFANGSLRFGGRFKIDAGVRQARNEQSFSQNVTAGILVPLGESPGESSEDVFTWSLSPQFQLSRDVMVYARAATGYQAGGPNVALLGVPPQVDSSMLTSYEVGLKSQFADRRVTFDLSAFRIEWDDIQVGVSFNGIGGLVNGGEATSEGFELATAFHATDRLVLGLNGAYTDGSVKNDFQPTVIPQDGFDVIVNGGLAGDRIPYAPKLSAAATAEYAFTTAGGFNGQVGGALRWVGDRLNGTTERQRVTAPGDASTVLQEDITPPLELDGYHSLDLYAGVGKAGWELRVFARNVTGERAYSSMNAIDSQVTGGRAFLSATPIQPRTYGVEVDYRF